MQALDNRSATFLLYAGIAGTAHEIAGNVIYGDLNVNPSKAIPKMTGNKLAYPVYLASSPISKGVSACE